MEKSRVNQQEGGRGRRRGKDYEFVPLKVAVGSGLLGQKVNVLGSVVEFGLHRKSKGTDYVYSLKIVDESYQDPAVAVNFFARTIEELPHVKSVGDVIQLSHVVMRSYAGEVLHVSEVSRYEWMLFVWDGTDTPPLNFETKLSDEAENPLPLQLEKTPLSRDILCTFPSVGSILRVFVSCEKFDLHLICGGQWVRLRSMICQVNSSFWCGSLMPSSKIRILSEDDSVVAQRLRSYNKRISSRWSRLPLCTSLCPSPFTETDDEHAPFSTLMDLLTYSEVTGKFKCVVRVLAVYPSRVEHFRSPIGMREYRLRLTLEDPTARIHAFLYGEDGVKFFDGYPPIEVLRKKRNQLLGLATEDEGSCSSRNDEEEKNISRNPPWVQCCLKSYYSDKSDTWGSRNYRIFGTRFVDQTT